MTGAAQYCLFGGGSFLIIIGVLMTALWPFISNKLVQSELQLTTTSTSFKMWRETPIPMYIDIYLFNWTNPEDVNNTDTGIKPRFDELGPYVFRESHERVNISWKEGFLVEFNQIRTYHFVPELSNGSLTDKVTNLNVIAATAAYTIRNHPILLWGLNEVFKAFRTKPSVTKTAGQWLFDGFKDPLLTVINIINVLNDTILPIDVPFDKFGWFYGRNLSWSYDGLFEMHTGEDDLANLGVLTRWNNKTKTNYYDSYCGMVNGTTGELWPPVYSTGNITLFASDICRSMMLEYNGTKNVEGVEGYVYVGNRHLLDNGDVYPENKCFCSNKPREEPCELPTGVANVSLCRYGAPAFVSYPHFYLSDPFYTDKIDMPNATDKDAFFLTLEPRTGIPLNVEAKLQINVLMKQYRQIAIFRKVSDAFMPAIWFNQRAQLTPELASKLQLLLHLPIIGISVFSVLFIIGVILLGVGVYKKMWGQWSVKKHAEHSVISSEVNDKNDVSTN